MREDEQESDSDEMSEADFKYSSQEECLAVVYSAEDIREFFKNTKWQKNLLIEEYFPDHKQFIHEVKHFRRKVRSLSFYRLKKLIIKVNRETPDDDV